MSAPSRDLGETTAAVSQRLFLSTLAMGILSLVGGLFLTRLNWRQDVPPFSRQSRFADIAIHPEKYASPKAVTGIRRLNTVGALFLLLALSVLVWQLVHVRPAG
jgi:hypothetical protein